MFTLVAGILMLGILVFIHEFGHFLVAKLAGVKVLKFSLGFGPKLVSFRYGETDYMICAIPLGGYVQMLGESVGEGGTLTPAERKRSFADKPVSRRMAIIAAGPFMNLILPFLVLPVAYLVGVHVPSYLEKPACVGMVTTASEAESVGFSRGDCILRINGDRVPTWSDANRALISYAGYALDFSVQRDGEIISIVLTPDDGGLEGLESVGLMPVQRAIVGALAPGMPAEKAGLQVGDEVLSINGQPIASWYDLRPAIQEIGEVESIYEVNRQGETLTFAVQTQRSEENPDEYLLGVAPQLETSFKRFGLVEAMNAGADRAMELIDLTLVFLQKLVAGHVPTKNIGGPITVIQVAGQAAQTDLTSILSVLAFLSIQLGILNLLPIPILDGGHLFFSFYELILRRPLSLKTREIAQQIGLILLLGLMIFAFYNDIVRIFFGG